MRREGYLQFHIHVSSSACMARGQIFWFVMVLVFVYAGVYNCLPVTFPIFKHVFGTSLEQMGRTQSVFSSVELCSVCAVAAYVTSSLRCWLFQPR